MAGEGQWRAWQDSNPQPLGPKPSALSIELQALAVGGNIVAVTGPLGRATGFEPVISCATDRRLDHSATLATQIHAIKYHSAIQAPKRRPAGRLHSPEVAVLSVADGFCGKGEIHRCAQNDSGNCRKDRPAGKIGASPGDMWDRIFYIPSHSVPKCPISSPDSRTLEVGVPVLSRSLGWSWDRIFYIPSHSVPKCPIPGHLPAGRLPLFRPGRSSVASQSCMGKVCRELRTYIR